MDQRPVCQRLYEEFTRMWQVIGPLGEDVPNECQDVYVKFLDAWEAALLHGCGGICGSVAPPTPAASLAAGRETTTPARKQPPDVKLRATCAECGNRFRNDYNLKAHMLVHTDERPFQCLECGNRFKGVQHLISHSMIHGNVSHKEAAERVYAQQPQLRPAK